MDLEGELPGTAKRAKKKRRALEDEHNAPDTSLRQGADRTPPPPPKKRKKNHQAKDLSERSEPPPPTHKAPDAPPKKKQKKKRKPDALDDGIQLNILNDDGGGEDHMNDGNEGQEQQVTKQRAKQRKKNLKMVGRAEAEGVDGYPPLDASLLDGVPFVAPPRLRTVSVALPVSIVANAQSFELRAYLVGQIARALTVFGVDEVVIYEDSAKAVSEGGGGPSRWLSFFCCNLQYLECPQYLRRALFPMHPDLKYAGLQNPLDAPHQMRQHHWMPYREGVVVAGKGVRESGGSDVEGSWVDCGLAGGQKVRVTQAIQPGVRVTVRLDASAKAFIEDNAPGPKGSGSSKQFSKIQRRSVTGTVVSPQEPAQRAGLYWGYQTRAASSLQEVFTHCPLDPGGGGYDLTIGTSERGDVLTRDYQMPPFKHLLIVFGGLGGLEEIVEDEQAHVTASDPRELFDQYVNVCPGQTSRTIRTEEALLITLAAFKLLVP
ncbi:unnamed protein product [Vitrella brassicaformis CCMP3155]|uniref:RNA methyltransferase n=1 Tax=Vitrella brassicaformis (strain CCMP3155) TaxID=1169540 RepID=A0A0G4FYB6_VITBC|nr:unnamed protein product [Vitrella brassicaformis CCMP3155]|eukprot:CEM20350.1 unnamed protein product [Vitrella brassicaformis CCMP3155]